MTSRIFSSAFELRATVAATVVGLSGALAYRYVMKPTGRLFDAQRAVPDATALTIPPVSLISSAAKHPGIELLDSMAALELLGTGRTVVLMTRGTPEADALRARAQFEAAVRTLCERPTDVDSLHFFVVDDASGIAPTVALSNRLRISLDKPYVVILDKFVTTERKFLMTTRDAPKAGEIVSFVRDFQRGALKPAWLGQPRPPGDRSEKAPVGAHGRSITL